MFLNEGRQQDAVNVVEEDQSNTFKENLRYVSCSVFFFSLRHVWVRASNAEACDALGEVNMRQFGVMVDVGAGNHKWYGSAHAPTLTSSRAASLSYYLPHRRQKCTAVELGRLQGQAHTSSCILSILCLAGLPDDLTRLMLQRVPVSVVGHAIGNAVSENVVERVLCKLLPAACLVSNQDELGDFWRDIQPLPPKKAGALF